MDRLRDAGNDRGGALVAPLQGEIWWAETESKRRPVLVVSRNQAIPVLTWLMVAPVTRTIRGIPTEIKLGPDDGIGEECAATFDNLQPLRKTYLTDRVGSLGPRRLEICRALAALADC